MAFPQSGFGRELSCPWLAEAGELDGLCVLGRPGRLALGDSRWRHDKGGKKPERETSGLLSFHLCHICTLIFQYPKGHLAV